MKRYFITATDTDCGKTYVICEMLKFLHRKNTTAIGLKPVASGCYFNNGELYSDDADKIKKINPKLTEDICYWKFLPPIAPHIAANLSQKTISTTEVIRFCEKSEFSDFDYVLIEGAGGLMAPLNNKETWIDFIKDAGLEVILVVGMRLGCINHALLTDAVLKQHQIPCLGWVANCLDPSMLVLQENIQTLQEKMTIPYLATISYQGELLSDICLQL